MQSRSDMKPKMKQPTVPDSKMKAVDVLRQNIAKAVAASKPAK